MCTHRLARLKVMEHLLHPDYLEPVAGLKVEHRPRQDGERQGASESRLEHRLAGTGDAHWGM